jgi:hypothetical protein
VKQLLFAPLLGLLFASGALGQTREFDHQIYISQLGSAKDSLYQLILSRYDKYIAAHPEDYTVQLERCKLINTAYYDNYEDYNPNYEEAEQCAAQLAESFPGEPEVLLYRLDFLYGDSLLNVLKDVEDRIDGSDKWKLHKWDVYHRLAIYYQYNADDPEMVIYYGEISAQENDTLDVSLMLAEAYQKQFKNARAIEVLVAGMDSANTAGELNSKGTMLMELGATVDAMKAFKWAAVKDEDYESPGELAQAMIDNGLVAEARSYLVKDFLNSNEWTRDQKVVALLEYELTHGNGDSAKIYYRKLTDDNFLNDAFGIYRLRLIGSVPLAGWTFPDFGRLFLFICLILAMLMIPYVWILPMFYIGEFRTRNGRLLEEPTFRWHLGHLWAASFLWMASDFIGTMLLDYPTILSLFNDRIDSEILPAVNKRLASVDLTFMTGLAVGTSAMIRREDVAGLFMHIRSNSKMILRGVALAFLLRFGLGIYVLLLQGLGVDVATAHGPGSGTTDAIMAINKYYHPLLSLLFVVIIVPIYEEILFRGIFLSAAQRTMRLVVANGLQSAVFALAHQDMQLFPFFFAFGMVAGYATYRTRSLLTGTSMHMTNNLIAWIAIVARG